MPSKRRPDDINVRRAVKKGGKGRLFIDEFESLCLEMDSLLQEPQGQFDDILDVFDSLSLSHAQIDWSGKNLSEILDYPWSSHFTNSDLTRGEIKRAIRLCGQCGIEKYRDILWYNDSLSQPAPLKKFPNCLVDMSHDLHDWSPRRKCPGIALNDWRKAWNALSLIWPNFLTSLPASLKRVFAKRYAKPPVGVNYFYFDFFDGVWDTKLPLLCFQDSCVLSEGSIDSPVPHSLSSSENEPSRSDTDDGNISDEDPRRQRKHSKDDITESAAHRM